MIKLTKVFVAATLLLTGFVQISIAEGFSKSYLKNNFVELEGVFSQGSILKGVVNVGSQVLLNNKPVRTDRNGNFIIGFGRDASESNTLSVIGSNGTQQDLDLKLMQRRYNTQSITGVPQKTVTPSHDKLERIRKETALVKKARRTDSDLPHFLDRFVVPIDAPVTGIYGSQRIYNGTPKRPHFGIDYAAPHGALVYAPASGKVTLVHDDMYYSGGTLIVDHGYGMSSTFIHLSEVLVKEGDEIQQGQEIAKVGSGGRSTGPHLDWRVNWYSTRIDPQLVLLLGE
jgi:murein DD-endopeptidase MepM/ murein hydrolase activator NlpD